MAVTADKVVVELELKDGQYLAKVKQAERQFTQSQDKIASSAKNTERQIRASSGAIASSLRNMAGAIAAGASVNAIKSMADSYTQMGNRLRVAGHEAGAASGQFEELMRVATDARTDIESVVQVYSRLTMATDGMGVSAAQVTRTTEILAKSLKASGATAQETSAALLQFGQGLGAGALMGDELRSIRENAPLVARAIAKEFDTTIGGLKKLGEDGKLTSDRVLKAVLASGQQVDALWANTVPTIADAFSNLRNQLIKYIGEADKAGGYSERLSKALGLLADNIDKVVPALATIATLFTAKWVGSMVAASVATDGFARKTWEAASSAIAAEKAKTAAVATETRTRTMLLNAEVVALQRQVATGRNAQGQFVSMAASQAALSARTRELAASMPAATAATLRNTGAIQGASLAARGLGAGFVALAGGPIPAVIIGLAALTLGLKYVIDNNTELAKTSKIMAAQTESTSKAFDEYRKAAEASAKATGEAKDAADRYTESKRAQYVMTMRSAQALAHETMQIYANRKALADAAVTEVMSGRTGRTEGEVIGQLAYASGALKEEAAAKKLATEANEAYIKSMQDYADLQEQIKNGFEVNIGGGGGVEDGGKKDKKAKDRRKETLDDLLEQAKIEEAQLRGQTFLVKQLEREAEIRGRIKSLVDAGYSQAQAEEISGGIQTRLDDAKDQSDFDAGLALAEEINLQSLKINNQIEMVRLAEEEAEKQALIAKYNEISDTETQARLRAEEDMAKLTEARQVAAEKWIDAQQKSHELRIAEILGDKERVKLLTDQEEIVRRTNELRAQGRMDEATARATATNQVTAERAATDYASQRDMFASTFSEGIRAAMAGDLKGFLSSQFGNLADQAFKRLGETLFDAVASTPADLAKAQIEGAAQGAAAGFSITTSMTTAAIPVGSTIAGAMIAAGTKVAALLKVAMSDDGSNPASAIVSAFAGNRAGGGPVRAGSSYTVGENGRERFVPSQNGYIIPNMKNLNAPAGAPSMVKLVVDEGAMFSARVEQISGPIAVQAAVTSTGYTNRQMRTQNNRRSQSFV